MSERVGNRSFWRLILATFALWTLFGVTTALQYYANSMPADRASYPLSRWATLTLSDNWLKALITVPLILALMLLHKRVKRWPLRLSAYLVLLFSFVCAHMALRPFVVPLVLHDDTKISTPKLSYLEKISIAARSFMVIDLMGFAVIALIFNAWTYAEEMQQRALNEERLIARLAQAELQALKMQLHPHFLFNTLNAIYNLAPENSRKAQLMIARLSDLLRLSLDHVSSNMVTLQQELEFLDCYLEIEKTRFEERLQLIEEIDPETLDASVPNLFLQPLVENAIRHGISKKAGGGSVAIRATRATHGNDRLRITITDNGRATPNVTKPGGIGLPNTRARLTQLFGADYTFEVQPTSDGMRVLIDIPFVPIESFQTALKQGETVS